jgi:GNAT superfamily N-acetyltransferase
MLTTIPAAAATYRRDLSDGLILRWSTAEDTENIAQLCSMVFRDKADEPANEFMLYWIQRLMRGDHPMMGPGDFGVVEDTRKEGNPLVACTCLWRHNWEYEGVPFAIGRPEIVASDPAYRNRGLVRALFEMVHARSEAEGHLAQAITGIPYFYRQFGYEYALDLEGKRVTYLSLIPSLKEGESEPYALREATVEDIPSVMEYYNRRRETSIVWADVSEHDWRYLLEGWKAQPERDKTDTLLMIVDATGAPKGHIFTMAKRRGKGLYVWAVDTAEGVNVQAVMPSVLRALQAYGLQMPTSKPDAVPLSEIRFILGRTHPVYDVLGDALAPFQERPYAWYVRVADLPAFIRHIAPALEQRLAQSMLAGYTGEIKLDFYQGGLRLVFEGGHLESAEDWRVPIYEGNAGAGFPPLVFLQVVFGHRTLDELQQAFPDVWVNGEMEVVLKTLFPARPSFVTFL